MRKIIIALLTLNFCAIVSAQNFEYGIQFKGIGDNREYFSPYNTPESILGSGLAADIGVVVDSVHKVRVGFDYFYEFGSDILDLKPDLILYYGVDQNHWKFKMGAFPYEKTLFYPQAMMADNYIYYNPTVDGLYLDYSKKNSRMSLLVDWVSRQDSVRREQFLAGFSGETRFGNIILEDYWYMFHNAGSAKRVEGVHIEDYMGGCLLLGYDFSSFLPLNILTVKTGVLSSLWRNRGTDGLTFNSGYSSYSEIRAEYKGVGVYTTAHFGDKHNFFFGDDYYNNAKNYIRTNLYFTPIDLGRVKGRFIWSLHFAENDMDHQQQFILSYTFSSL